MNDPELFAHLMAEITGRFEYLATEAANLQHFNEASAIRLEAFCRAADSARQLAHSARVLFSESMDLV